MLEETGAPVPDAARAHVAARDVFGMGALWDEIGTLDGKVPSDVQLRLWLNLRQVVERGVLWLLRHRRPPLEIGATVTAFQPGVAELMDNLPEAVVGAKAEEVAGRRATFVEAGVPVELAHRAAAWPLLHTAFDIIEVAHARGRPVVEAAAAYWKLFDELDLNWLWDRIGLLPRADRWQTHARAGR